MGKGVAVFGLVLAALAASGAAVFALQVDEVRQAIARFKENVEAEMRARGVAQSQSATAAPGDVEFQNGPQPGGTQDAISVETMARALTQPGNPLNLIGNLLSEESDPVDTETAIADAEKAKESLLDALYDLFGDESDGTLADMSAAIAVDMAYQALFDQWDLPEETEGQVRVLLGDYLAEQIETALQLSQTDLSDEAAGSLDLGAADRLRAKLAAVLTSEQIAQWDEYERTLGEHIVSPQFDAESGVDVPLTGDIRALVGKWTAYRDVIDDLSLPDQRDGQVDVLDRARERLEAIGKLDEAQFAELERIVSLMQEQLEVLSTMTPEQLQAQLESENAAQTPPVPTP